MIAGFSASQWSEVQGFGPIKGWNRLNFGEMRHCRATEELRTTSVLATVYLKYIFFEYAQYQAVYAASIVTKISARHPGCRASSSLCIAPIRWQNIHNHLHQY